MKFIQHIRTHFNAFMHPVYHTERKVERRTVRKTTRDWERCRMIMESDHTYQELVEVTTRNGKPWTRRVLDRETVPEDVMITLGCFGDTGSWRSRFTDVIGEQRQREQNQVALAA